MNPRQQVQLELIALSLRSAAMSRGWFGLRVDVPASDHITFSLGERTWGPFRRENAERLVARLPQRSILDSDAPILLGTKW